MSIDERMLLRRKIQGILIRDARSAAGKTQKECAAFLGMPASTLSDIEHGERSVSLPELEAFSYLVDVPVEHFWGDQLLETDGKKPLPVEEIFALRDRVIGVLLRQARLALGMSQEECSRAINVPESRISAYEHGQTAVPLVELEALAEFLEVPLETFIDEEHNPIGKITRRGRALEQLSHLPEDMQVFVTDPLNADYLRTALRLSRLPADHLRGIAEALLEITY